MKQFCNIILVVISSFIIVLFLFLIFNLISSNGSLSELIHHFYPNIDMKGTVSASDLVLRNSAFVLQYVSWIFTIGAFGFTALGFLGVQRMIGLKGTEEEIKKNLANLKQEHEILKKHKETDLQLMRAKFFYLQEVYEDAWEIFDRMSDDHSFEVCLYKGLTLTKMGDYVKAIAIFESSLRFPDADKSRIYYNIGKCWLKTKVYEKAIEFFNKAIDEKSSFIDAYIDKAIALKRSGYLKNAVVLLRQLCGVDPNNTRVNYNLACYLASLDTKQDQDEALNYLGIAIKLNSSKYIKMAKEDPDFILVREDARFKELTKQEGN